jgi:hypothetical protein
LGAYRSNGKRVGKEKKHIRRREQGPRPPLVRGFD